MILCLCIIIYIIGCCLEASGSDWEQAERNKERRHRELMEAQRKRKSKSKRVTRRRIIRDENGRFIAEEISMEGDIDG